MTNEFTNIYIDEEFEEIINSNLYFINHHYLQKYKKIISKFKERNFIKKNYPGFHNHHMIPRCLKGSNKKENLVLLSPREHYIIHHLLWKAFPKTDLVTAFKGMVCGFIPDQRITSKVYENLCLDMLPILRERARGNTNNLGKKRTPEQCKNISDGHKGIVYGPCSEEKKQKISYANIGRKRDPVLNQIHSEFMKGNTNMLGFKHSDKSKEQMSKSAKNKPPISEATRLKMKNSRKNRPPICDATRFKMIESAKNKPPVSEKTKLLQSEKAKARGLQNTVWVCSATDKKQIKKEFLDEYLSRGYIKGMKYRI